MRNDCVGSKNDRAPLQNPHTQCDVLSANEKWIKATKIYEDFSPVRDVARSVGLATGQLLYLSRKRRRSLTICDGPSLNAQGLWVVLDGMSQRIQPVGRGFTIVVDEGEKLSASLCYSSISGSTHVAPGLKVIANRHAVESVTLHHRWRSIDGSVVDHDRFPRRVT